MRRWWRSGHSGSVPVRPSRRSGHPGSQQFRASRRLASELAQGADLSPVDLVLEFGAGDGRLTAELASRARHVVAIEVDERLAVRLDARFHGDRAVTVVHGDALRTPLPRSTFKVVSNPPFHLTAALLHHLLDDPRLPLLRADMVLGWGAALSLTAVHPPSRRSLMWQPWYELLLIRRLDSSTSSRGRPPTQQWSPSAGEPVRCCLPAKRSASGAGSGASTPASTCGSSWSVTEPAGRTPATSRLRPSPQPWSRPRPHGTAVNAPGNERRAPPLRRAAAR